MNIDIITTALADPGFVSRLFKHISPEPNSGCWLWGSKLDHSGYGVATFRARSMRAHRVMYAHSGRALMPDVFICHSCDNPTCVNPDHLFAGTSDENVADMMTKGRVKRWLGERAGDANPCARLSIDDVHEVLRMRRGGQTYVQIAERFGVSPSTVGAIIRGDSWPHVSRNSKAEGNPHG